MAGDVILNNATVTINVEAVNIHGNPAEVSQRLDQIAGSINSLQQGLQTMATGQELTDALDELGGHLDAIESAVNNAEARLTAAIKAGQSGAQLQQVVDTAFEKVKGFTGKAKAAADDLNDEKDEADTGTGGDTGGGDTGGGDTGTGNGDTGTGGDTGSGDTGTGTDPNATLRRR